MPIISFLGGEGGIRSRVAKYFVSLHSQNPKRSRPRLRKRFPKSFSSAFRIPIPHDARLDSITLSCAVIAETEGFEPSRAFKPYLVSSEALSATQPRLRVRPIIALFLEKSKIQVAVGVYGLKLDRVIAKVGIHCTIVAGHINTSISVVAASKRVVIELCVERVLYK